MADNMNMRSITIERFTKEIQEEIFDENYNPMIGIGKSGVGKTMSICELCKKNGYGYKEVRLVTMTETDMYGVPTVEDAADGRKVTTWATNDIWPIAERDGDVGILVLDEITSCSSTVRAAAFQLLDSKRSLGTYHLPEHWKIVALGNGADDGGVYVGMEGAFLNRGTCYRIEPDLQSWKKWAIDSGVNSSVVAYLSFSPESLHVFDPDADVEVFPSPRSWTGLAAKLSKREERAKGMLELEDVEFYAAGLVGEIEASKFSAFYAYNKKTISVTDILDGKASTDVSGFEAQTMYLIIQGLVKEIGRTIDNNGITKANIAQDAGKPIVNAVKWLVGISNYKLDFSMTGISDLVAGCSKFTSIALSSEFDVACPEFLQFCMKNSIVAQ